MNWSGPMRAVPGRVAVELAVVGVGDRLRPAPAVERPAADGRLDVAVLSQAMLWIDPAVT